MLKSRILVGIAVLVVIAMVGVDWIFPTYMFYSPRVESSSGPWGLLAFKKQIELALSVLLGLVTAGLLRLRQSGSVERFFASVAIGIAIGLWLHGDMIYLLFY